MRMKMTLPPRTTKLQNVSWASLQISISLWSLDSDAMYAIREQIEKAQEGAKR